MTEFAPAIRTQHRNRACLAERSCSCGAIVRATRLLEDWRDWVEADNSHPAAVCPLNRNVALSAV